MKLYFETSTGHLHKQGEELCGDKVEIVKRDPLIGKKTGNRVQQRTFP